MKHFTDRIRESFPQHQLQKNLGLYDSGSVAVFSQAMDYRYALVEEWDRRCHSLAFVMLNPSTADAISDDPTVVRCRERARRMQYGGFAIFNLFALRATDPRALRRHPDPVGPNNDWYLRYLIDSRAMTIAGWGAFGNLRGRDEEVRQMFVAASLPLYCLGITACGAPRHPLYVGYAIEPVEWAKGGAR